MKNAFLKFVNDISSNGSTYIILEPPSAPLVQLCPECGEELDDEGFCQKCWLYDYEE